MEQKSPYFLWVDLEMTGLNPAQDVILEVAAIVTNYQLEAKASFHQIVFQPQETLDNMDPWCVQTHGKSGLTKAVASGKPLQEVETMVLDFLKPFFPSPDAIILCGNTISQDRAFIQNYMSRLYQRLHYRVLDVSAFKEVFTRLYDKTFSKKESHRALDDIEESIEELKYYLQFVNLSPIV